MDKRDPSIYDRSKKIIVQYAIFRWENALILAGAILLTVFYPRPFSWWPIWGWPILGLLGVGLIFYSSLQNTEANAQLLLQSFQDSFDLRKIRLPELREDVKTALEYQRRIDDYILDQKDSVLRDRAKDTANQISKWIGNVYQLARQIDMYQRDTLLKQEMEELPIEIAELEAERLGGIELQAVEDFNQLLESKNKHLETLRSLSVKMQQAEYQLDHSVSALATVDSQMRLIAAQGIDHVTSESLRADIQEQVNRLDDLIASIDEVYRL